MVILRVGIEPPNLAHTPTGRIIRDARHVQDAETRGVHALVGVFSEDVLVVVDGAAGSLVVTGLLRVLEIADVPDEGYGAAVGGGTARFDLVVFVVGDEPFLVFGVEDPALVGVGGAFVGGDGDGLGELLVGNIV